MGIKVGILALLITLLLVYSAIAQYTLLDDDVVVSDGIIQSCSYDFGNKDIIIPDTLDGQAVTGIADGKVLDEDVYEGVFVGKGIESVIFPSTLESIGKCAFSYNNLDSINLSACSVLATIGGFAFCDNTLARINLSNCSALEEIEDYTFYSNRLTSTDLSGCIALEAIGYMAFSSNMLSSLDFSDCSSLSIIGGSAFASSALTSIDFSGCTALDVIGESAFAHGQLTSIDLSACSALSKIDNWAFYSNDLASIDLSACNALETIGSSTFARNGLTTANLSGCTALSSIGNAAFYLNNLKNIDLIACSELNKIGSYAFAANQSLGSFALPVNLDYSALGWKDDHGNTYEGGGMVSDFISSYYVPIPYTITDDDVVVTAGIIGSCSYGYEYTDIIIPEILDGQTVTGIADKGATNGVFYRKPITSIVFPPSMETIGDGAFRQCDLLSIDLSDCKALRKIGLIAFRGNALSDIDFSGCSALTTIEAAAFSENAIACIDLNGCTALTVIGENAFSENALTSIDLSPCKALTTIGIFAFMNDSLSSFALPVNSEFDDYGWKDTYGNVYAGGDTVSDLELFYYVPVPYVLKDEDVEVTNSIIQSCSYDFHLKNIIIPDSLDGQPVIGIGDWENRMVFASKGILSIALPATVVIIGEGAFFQNDLTSAGIDLDACTSLSAIGKGAFDANYSLTFIKLPVHSEYSLHGWKDDSGNSLMGGDTIEIFNRCYYIPVTYTLSDKDVVVTDNVIQSCNYSFALRDIVIPDTLDGQVVTEIVDMVVYDGVFASKGIMGMALPSTLRKIGDYTFVPNYLTSIILPQALESIGEGAFMNNDLSDIALSGCTALISIGKNAFNGNHLPGFTLPVPDIPGYLFNHWRDGNGNIYEGGSTVSDLATSYTGSLTAIYTVTVTITDGTNPVVGAEVLLEDYGTVKTDSAGTAVFNSVLPDDELTCIVTAPGFEDATYTISVVDDDILVTLTLTGNTGIQDTRENHFRIYPNPAISVIHIQLEENAVVTVIDMIGRALWVQEYERGHAVLPVDLFKPGHYIIRARTTGGVFSEKVLIE